MVALAAFCPVQALARVAEAATFALPNGTPEAHWEAERAQIKSKWRVVGPPWAAGGAPRRDR